MNRITRGVWPKKILLVIGVLIAYSLSILVGRELKDISGIPIVLDPAIGVLTALTLVYGLRLLPAILAAALVGQFLSRHHLWDLSNCLYLLGTSFQVLGLQWLTRSRFFNLHITSFKRLQDFIFIALVSGLLGVFAERPDLLLFKSLEVWLLDFPAQFFSGVSGVIIFTPLTYLIIGPPEFRREQFKFLVTSSLFIISGFFCIAHYTRIQGERLAVAELNLVIEKQMEVINKTLLQATNSLAMMESHRATSENYEYSHFKIMAEKALELNPLLRAVTWVPQVEEGQLPQFEARISRKLRAPFRVFEKKQGAVNLKSSSRHPHWYYPVTFIYPLKNNEKALGYDLSSEWEREKAIQLALESQHPAVTTSLHLVQSNGRRFGSIIYFYPCRIEKKGPYREELFSTVIDLDFLLKPLLEISHDQKIEFILRDVTTDQIMGSSLSGDRVQLKIKKGDLETNFHSTSMALRVGQQDWEFLFFRPKGGSPSSVLSWFIFYLGLFISTATTLGILLISGNVEELKKMLRALSHDIVNPLSVILGWSDRGQRLSTHLGDEKLKLMFAKITNAALEQQDIVEHFRKMRAVADGKCDLNLTHVSLEDVFLKMQALFEQKLKNKKISLILNPEDFKDTYVLAEKTSLCHNVLNNILSNAIKFSEPGSTIELKISKTIRNVKVVVIDHGIGMPPSLLENLFNPEAKTSRPGTQMEPGTGFGMPVVYSYMQRYGGKIQISSRCKEEFPESHGTVVTLTFISEAQDL